MTIQRVKESKRDKNLPTCVNDDTAARSVQHVVHGHDTVATVGEHATCSRQLIQVQINSKVTTYGDQFQLDVGGLHTKACRYSLTLVAAMMQHLVRGNRSAKAQHCSL